MKRISFLKVVGSVPFLFSSLWAKRNPQADEQNIVPTEPLESLDKIMSQFAEELGVKSNLVLERVILTPVISKSSSCLNNLTARIAGCVCDHKQFTVPHPVRSSTRSTIHGPHSVLKTTTRYHRTLNTALPSSFVLVVMAAGKEVSGLISESEHVR